MWLISWSHGFTVFIVRLTGCEIIFGNLYNEGSNQAKTNQEIKNSIFCGIKWFKQLMKMNLYNVNLIGGNDEKAKLWFQGL